MIAPLPTRGWAEQEATWPQQGRSLLAHHDADGMIVYQAFRHEIAGHAVTHQRFGGPFSLDRMSWIKPGFLWMMHRSGWATKPGQERILAVRLPHEAFREVLAAAVPASFDPDRYRDHTTWQAAVKASAVRVQWDPDHDPHGRPLARRAIQLGLRGPMLRAYAHDWPTQILDITDYVTAQHALLREHGPQALTLPIENSYPPENSHPIDTTDPIETPDRQEKTDAPR